MTHIESNAFYGCCSLTTIVVDETNSFYDSREDCNAIIKTVDNELIQGCLTTVIPNSVMSIGDCAFSTFSNLTSIIIPNSVINIGSNAFSGCSGLSSIIIPNSVINIGSSAFAYCLGLSSITIPNSVISVESFTFEGCTGLTSIIIPNSVTSIGFGAFQNCTGLKSVTIGKSVEYIDVYAFYNTNISTVISLIDNPFVIPSSSGFEAFSQYTFNNAILYIPAGTIDKYKATVGWKDFVHIVEGTDNTDGLFCVSNQTLLFESSEGILTVFGAEVGTPIYIYDTSGKMVGSAKAGEGITTIRTPFRSRDICIAKVGEKIVKVFTK